MSKEQEILFSRWFNVLTKTKKQEFEQVVHMGWEAGSIYFDTVKIYRVRPMEKAESGQVGLALLPVVKHV